MKTLFSLALTAFLSINVFASSSSDINYKNTVKIDSFGTCYMTFTAYNAAGEALYSWTEEIWAYSWQNCQDLGGYRLKELNSGTNSSSSSTN